VIDTCRAEGGGGRSLPGGNWSLGPPVDPKIVFRQEQKLEMAAGHRPEARRGGPKRPRKQAENREKSTPEAPRQKKVKKNEKTVDPRVRPDSLLTLLRATSARSRLKKVSERR
jgi:hypothetical protein